MPIISSKDAHVLLASHGLWGHVRPIVGFACKVVKACPNVIITLPVAGDLQHLSEKEIDRYLFSEEDKYLRENIRVINLGGDGLSVFVVNPIIYANIGPLFESLQSLSPVKCSTGRVYTYTRKPDVVVADYFMLDPLREIRGMSQIPILCWNPTAISPLLRLLGPEYLCGIGDIEARAVVLSEKTGMSVEKAEMEIFQPHAGEVLRSPGLPPMFDYEYYPQKNEPHMVAAQLMFTKKASKMISECDGIISAASTAYEFEGCKAAHEWFAQSNRPAYTIGPLLPDDILFDEVQITASELDVSPNGQDVITFLDKVLASSGPQSVIYVSFGTLFWPTRGECIWKTLEIILDMGIPLLLAYDKSRLGEMPENLGKKFEASEKALSTPFAPQHTVLKHESIGWFLTHGGYNSLIESVLQNVPMIGWPLGADQPANVAHMTVNLNIAYEILEARSGFGLNPMYRGITPKGTLEALEEEVRTILQKAFGEDGRQKRENIRQLKEKIKAGWREDGDSSVDLKKFIKDFLVVN